nr:pentatricopeptide repeat-containing protein At1g71060, mitochondrial [Ipomoea batatas]
MGLSRVFSRLAKTPLTSLYASPKPFKNHSQIHPNLHNFTHCLPAPQFNRIIYAFHRSIHERSVNPHPNNQNPDSKPQKIIEQTDHICKIVLNVNHRASQKEFNSNLNSASVVPSPALVAEVLKRLSNSGVLALWFFRWAEKKDGFQYTAHSYHALIEALGKIKQFKMVWICVDEMKNKGVLSRETFALVSRRFARARKVKDAIKAFEMMENKYGMKAELQDFNRLFDTLCKSRAVGRAHQVFDEWRHTKFSPDIKSYTILLEGFGEERNLLKLNEVYREMRDAGFEPDAVSYGIMINAHCKAREYDKAVEMFHEMKRKKIEPTPHIYCTLINGLGSVKKLSEALEFFELCKSSGCVIEVPTYNAVVGAYCWSSRMDDAYRIIDEMRASGIGPNARTYDIILHHLIKAQRIEEAYSVFQKMENDPRCEPTVSTYEIIVRMFCCKERIDMAMAMRVWDKMKGKGILPTMHMFSTLINSLCQENKSNFACRYFQEMLDLGIRPPLALFSNLKQALLDKGEKDTVIALAEKVEKLRKTQLVG